jgi:hypothetical protein
MRHDRLIRTGIAAAILTVAMAGCNQRKATAPELQTTAGVQPRMEPMTVIGCLRSGVSDNTFVLMASQAAGAGETATYQLTGPERLNLREYVGQKVEISGTLRAEKHVTSSGGSVAEKPAKGTTGTPVVETKSEVEIKQLDVSSVKPTGNRCEG